ncbi:epoxyqueuosine reductase QueH [Chloroflexota bacterium]
MKVILHICCGICAAGVVERLTSEGHQVNGFFYNPNIHPQEEYQRRLEVACKVSEELNFPLETESYKPEEWLKATDSLKDEPEGGQRCALCFQIRLDKTFQYLQNTGGDVFATTLSISPHKSVKVINQVGQEIGGEQFLIRDFKKKAGFQRTIELAKEWSLYQQNYCGCLYSLKK